MSVAIPAGEPTEITAGETVKWTVAPSEHPTSEGWALTYYIRGAQQLDKLCTYDGTDYLATLSAAETAALNTGTTKLRYWWQAFAVLAGETYLVDDGEFDVMPSLVAVAATFDGRSHAKIVIDAIEALLAGKATRDQHMVMVGDRQLTRLSPSALMEWLAIYEARYAAEQADAGNATTGGRVLARFTNP